MALELSASERIASRANSLEASASPYLRRCASTSFSGEAQNLPITTVVQSDKGRSIQRRQTLFVSKSLHSIIYFFLFSDSRNSRTRCFDSSKNLKDYLKTSFGVIVGCMTLFFRQA
jgi:c-di-GMP-binding flagellar brake protein YcgR